MEPCNVLEGQRARRLTGGCRPATWLKWIGVGASILFGGSALWAQGDFYIEAEDFNYGGGQHKAAASVMPYLGGAYNGLSAVHNVDYHRTDNQGAANEYRQGENPNVPMTSNMKPADVDRGTWTVTTNYRLGWINGNAHWMNYTRNFPDGYYRVYAALSINNTTPDGMRASLQEVTSGATTTSQTVVQLGQFRGQGLGTWGVNNLAPLYDTSGEEAILHLNGLKTLRITTELGDIDYLKFARLSPPTISVEPADQTGTENEPVTFQVQLSNTDPVAYQWQSNRVDIPGANAASYTIAAVPWSANSARFRCVITNVLGTATSHEALLTLNRDTTRPRLDHLQNIGTDTLEVVFTEGVAAPSATNPANYALNRGVTVTGAQFGEDERTILLSVNALVIGQSYVLTVNNVRDRAANPNTILPNSQMSFRAVEYAPIEVGSPGLAGSSTPVPGGFDVSGAGSDIGGGSDQFHFDYRAMTGNFDLALRVAAFSPTDPFAKAGLMARATLDPDAKFAAAFASPGLVGCYFMWRSSTGSSTSQAGRLRTNFPYTWLRLKRSGSTFTAYAGFDGVHWTPLGSRGISMPSQIFVGQAVTSRDPSALATAAFRDLGAVSGAQTAGPAPEGEELSPSSRRTKVVVSEIMYHPRARTDGRELEFVELANPSPIFEDLSGWRISGAIDYTFPDGTTLPADGFLVVAKVPADVEAEYGLTGVLGPYSGALQNSSGVVRVRNKSDAIELEAVYRGEDPWPASADGGGHSLVLARPSYGESFPEAWAASALVGGSPGRNEAIVPNPFAGVVINEFLAHTDEPLLDAVELFNGAAASVDLSNCVLTDDPATNKFRINAGTTLAAGGFLAFDQNQLGFALNAAGETIYLINPDGTRVIDAIAFGAQANGISSGRYPDGGPRIRLLQSPTLGTANTPFWESPVIINEIMYHPLSGLEADEYIELYNRTAQPVDLSGWRFTEGVKLTIPDGVTLAVNDYLVVAKDAANLIAHYPQLTAQNTVGDYSGKLSNAGERLVLTMPDDIVGTNDFGAVVTNHVHIAVDQVDYRTGGRWGRWSDGDGSSLELVDPRADNELAPNWADSDETAKAQWVTAEATGRLDNGNRNFGPNRLYIGLQGAGECLVDDVEVFPSGGGNVVANNGFESGTSGWSFFGNHSKSSVQTGGAASGNRCLHIRASGDSDTGPNTIRRAISGLSQNQVATIRAKVRWLTGWPQVLFRLHGNWFEMSADMQPPRNLGTPGQPNSRALANVGPAITEVVHHPILPQAGDAVTVTARVDDPDGVSLVQLRYRVDPSTSLTTVSMRDDGAGGDARANDGIWTGTIPAQSSGKRVAFFVQARDGYTSPAVTRFPALYPDEECVVRWGDPLPFGNFTHYHLWTTTKTDNAFNAVHGLDNQWWDATLVHRDGRVIYNAKFRNKASPYHGGKGDFAVTVPKDDLLLGVTDRVFGQTGNANSEATAMRGQVANWVAYELGIPFLHSHYMQFYRNGSQYHNVTEDLEQPNTYYAERWFPEGGDGDLYKIAVWFEFQDNNASFKSTSATMQKFTTTGGAYKLARYRWNWQRRSNDGDANNYRQLLDLMTAANASGRYEDDLLQIADVEQWMRVHAFHRITGNWDAWTFRVGQNMYIYRRAGERWVIMPWDVDFVLGLGNGPTDGLWGGQDPTGNRMYDTPVFRRALWRAFQDAVAGPMLPENYQPQIDARRRALLANGVSGAQDPAPIGDYLDQRRAYLQSQIAANDASQFAITTSGGNDFSTTTPLVTLTGTAPFAAARIAVNGVPYATRWANFTTFQIAVPLPEATNVLVLTGLDEAGNPIPGMSDSITVTYTGELQRPEDFLVINEIMYHPDAPGTGFVELYNQSTRTTFDLSGWQLSGASFTFPAGTVIAPGTYLLVVNDPVAFEAAFGSGLPVVGTFGGNLDNGGETLRLVRPGATPAEDFNVDVVKYDDDPPWPGTADGLGASLQLIDPSRDNWRVANWATGSTNGVDHATPGAVNSVRASLPAFPPLWINEVLPENTRGLTDSAGDLDPWLEIYNAGATDLNLGALYLTDDYNNLTRWRFPSVVVPAGGFLVVWADGEPGESTPAEPHASFRLTPATGSVALVWMQSGSPAVLDYVDYRLLSPDRGYGSYPDGDPRGRRVLHFPTPGAANNPASIPVQVFINEWMASNNSTVADPADGDFDDWFELYNAGPEMVDLTGYTLTDDLLDHTKHVIPPGIVIQSGDHLLVWADNESRQTAPGGDLHVSFKLTSTGEAIGLYAPDGTTVDELTFGPQTSDQSEGRQPDGAPAPFVALPVPTPGQPNSGGAGNLPPVLAGIGNRVVQEGNTLAFTATATDDDNPPQQLTYSLVGGPAGASINPVTGAFSWTPTEVQGPGAYPMTVWVTDDGVPSRADFETFTVTVNEVNEPPTLGAIPDVTLDEGSALTFTASALDADLPANDLTFSLLAGAPAGATIHPTTGAFSWTPTEAQGPSMNPIAVRVTDNGSPQLHADRAFTVTVREVDNPPVLDPISDRTITELQAFTFSANAADPDSPPRAVRYSLDAGAPSGAAVDPVTGVFTWTPAEDQGPGSYPISLRATEQGGAGLSSARTFTLNVDEDNQAPTLSAVPDQTVDEGGLLVLQLTGSDADLPAQQLTYSLAPGAPAEMILDPATGLLTWAVPVDHQPLLNDITVRVTDDGVPPLSAQRTFRITVEPRLNLVLNELMYEPATPGTEFVEIHNVSATRTASLAGLRLEGHGLSYAFGAGDAVPAGGFVTVARNLPAFAAAYPDAPAPLGAFTGNFVPAGERLRLFRPGTGGQPDEVIDSLAFDPLPPWPADAAGQGGSMQLIDPSRDNRRPANWAAVAGLVPTQPTTVVPMTGTWRYHQLGQDLGTAWRQPDYDDSSWPSGQALLYVENSSLPAPKNTPLTRGPWTFYFRTTFNFTGNPAGVALRLTTIIDDAAVFYLNGQPLYNLGMPSGEILYDTPAGRVVGNAVIEGPFDLPGDLLVSGENVLAVEVHQHGLNSSDIVMGCELELVGGPLSPFTPGAPNSLAATLDATPPLWLNEVQTGNATGPRDNTGAREPWLELVNAGPLPVPLDGWFLSDDPAVPGRFALPAGVTLAPGEHRLVWLDGQTGQTAPGAIHANFSATGAAGVLVLAWDRDGSPAAMDALRYTGLGTDQAFGNVVDADPEVRDLLASPTPGATNDGGALDRPPTLNSIPDIVINEGAPWTYTASATDPDLPDDHLTFSLAPGAPAGLTIDPESGRLSWTPAESDGPGVFDLTVRVADAGTPPLTDEEPFQLTVREVNAAPVLDPLSNAVFNERGTLHLTATANDPDEPANQLTFSLAAGAPAAMQIDPATGHISWQTTEVDGPGSYPVTVIVTDDGTPARSDQQTLTLTVREVNQPPGLLNLADQTVNEGATLSLTARAIDPDLPAQTLTYSLAPGAPAGAAIHPSTGVFTWTPGEAVGGSTFGIIVQVADDANPPGTDTEAFQITVNEVNQAPTLAAIADQTVNEGATLSVTAQGSDADQPAQTLTYSLGAGAPAGATINPTSGVLTWTPGEADGPGTYDVKVVVTDDGSPAKQASRTFQVTVNEVNQAPTLAAIADQTVNENTTLVITAKGSDADQPAQTLTYSMGAGAPAGVAINPTSGVLTWTPGEADGPGTYDVKVVVTDDGTPAKQASRKFQITVNEVNQAPTLAAIGDQTVNEGAKLTLTAQGSDADEPAQTLTYSLAAGAPAGATIDPTSGVFTWTPPAGSAGDHTVTVVVRDDGTPVQEDRVSFTVTVKAVVTALVIEPPVLTPGGGLELRWEATPGVVYVVEYTEDLAGPWTVLAEFTSAEAAASFRDPDGTGHGLRFYRIRQK